MQPRLDPTESTINAKNWSIRYNYCTVPAVLGTESPLTHIIVNDFWTVDEDIVNSGNKNVMMPMRSICFCLRFFPLFALHSMSQSDTYRMRSALWRWRGAGIHGDQTESFVYTFKRKSKNMDSMGGLLFEYCRFASIVIKCFVSLLDDIIQ